MNTRSMNIITPEHINPEATPFSTPTAALIIPILATIDSQIARYFSLFIKKPLRIEDGKKDE